MLSNAALVKLSTCSTLSADDRSVVLGLGVPVLSLS